MRKEEIEAIKSNSNIIDVISRHVAIDKKGSEYYGICPFHDDKRKSLQVNEEKQIFKCFACGEGGDSIAFLTKNGASFKDAISEIKGEGIATMTGGVKNITVKKQADKLTYVPSPEQFPTNFNHYQFGEPSMIWTWKNPHGNVLGYTCRFDLDDGDKAVLPYSCYKNERGQFWKWRGMPTPRPLYNWDLIHNHPKATILVVEGEKTADAAQKELNSSRTVVTTWLGGANGFKNANFEPINDRKCVFLADNDVPGFKAMNEISDLIETKTKKFVLIPSEFPEKWDVADKDWTQGELRKFIVDNFSNEKYTFTEELPAPKPTQTPKKDNVIQMTPPAPKPAPKNPPLPPVKIPEKTNFDNEHFRLLGYDKDETSKLVYYFFSFDAKSVIKLSPSSMNKSNLMTIAPINYWEDRFPGAKTKIDIDAVQQFLIGSSHRVGPFRDKYIRGRGAWMDEDKLVVHTGEHLLTGGQLIPLRAFKSRFVYEIGETLGFGNGNPLKSHESVQLIKKIEWLRWDRDISAFLLAGWCVIAPFCGVLKWRPHIWITGAAGTGKSYVMEHMIKQLMGEVSIVVQGKTTEAGVRGTLKSDARPVLFDESDVDSYNDKERIQSILALARSSSYSDGGEVVKGTQSGSARSYVIRSCFAFSSIGVQLNQQSDRSRFTMLSLKSFEGYRTKEDFAKFELDWKETITEDYVKSLQARTMELLPVILENSRTFSDAASHVIGNRRIGDQIGGMLAGAFSLQSTDLITYDAAIDWIKRKDWDEERGMEQTKDEMQLFSLMMSYMLRVEGVYSTVERSIGELILCSADQLADVGITRENANTRLRRVGIMVNEERIYISNTAPGVKEIIKHTAWASNHNKILERLPDSEKLEPRTFYPGLKSRGISLPISMISDGFQFEKFKTEEEIKPTEMSFEDDTEDDVPF